MLKCTLLVPLFVPLLYIGQHVEEATPIASSGSCGGTIIAVCRVTAREPFRHGGRPRNAADELGGMDMVRMRQLTVGASLAVALVPNAAGPVQAAEKARKGGAVAVET